MSTEGPGIFSLLPALQALDLSWRRKVSCWPDDL